MSTSGDAAVGRAPAWARPAVPLGVIACWAAAVTILGLWERVGSGVAAAVTMVFGSLVAGSTPQGGGAVAFPVFTKLLDVPAAAARTFSLSIQAVGMGSAAALIVIRGLPVAWRAVRIVTAAAAMSFLVGLAVLTTDGPFRPSVLSDDVTKVGFTVVVAALAVLTTRLRGVDLRRVDVDLDASSTRVLVATGVVGGLLCALVGSGADVVAFLALTLLFGVRPAVAVPTSVVIMALISILGLATLGLLDGQLLAATPTVDLPSMWLAAVPVVAVGAPVGSWLASKASDRVLLGVVVTLAATEVASTAVFLDRLRMDPLLAGGAVVLGTVVVRRLWAAHRRRVDSARSPADRPVTRPRPDGRLVLPSPVPAVPTPGPGGPGSGRPAPDPSGPSDSRQPTTPARAAGAHDRGAPPMPPLHDHRRVLVSGVPSRSGHVNHPQARYCHRTGLRLEHPAGLTTTGPRPPLGVLCTDEGASHPLTVDVVIGRDPSRHRLVTGCDADPLELHDPSGALSRAHLLLTLRGWDIRVADLGSTNGTWMRADATAAWERLVVGEAVTIPSGAMVTCGGRQLRVDHLHVR